jgi:hypothetical protein
MRTDMHQQVSHDRLNAFVDRDLDRFEEARVLDAIQRDPELVRQACELRFAKDVVRNAYLRETLRSGRDRTGVSQGGRCRAVAAVPLVAIGAGSGWMARDGMGGPSESTIAWWTRHPAALRQVASTDRVLLHVSSSAPERVSNLLDEAEDMLQLRGPPAVLFQWKSSPTARVSISCAPTSRNTRSASRRCARTIRTSRWSPAV